MNPSRRRLVRIVLLAVILGVVGYASWYGWRRYSAPQPPSVALDRANPEVAEAVQKAIGEVRRHPYSGPAWGELSFLLIANGFYDPALLCLVEAEKLEPDQPSWPYLYGSVSLVLSKPREGLPKLREALARTRKLEDRKAVLYLLAQTLVEEGQLEEAEVHIRALRELDRDNPRLEYTNGLFAVARGDRAVAQDLMSRLTEHPCARKQACSILATLTQDDPKLAAEYRAKATQLPADLPWPSSFDDLVRRRRVTSTSGLEKYNELLASEQREEALEYLRHLAETAPDEQVTFTLGFALFRIGAFESAEVALRQALGFNPNNARAHTFLGAAILERAESKLKEPGGAEAANELFREAVRSEEQASLLQSDSALPYYLSGRALKQLGRKTDAEKAFHKAVLLGPDLYEAHQALGELLAEEGRIPEGLEHLENAVRVAPPQNPIPKQALDKWKRAKAPR